MKALLLCASHNDLGLIKALNKLGYYIVVTGNKEGLIGQRYADKYIKADYSDMELILTIAKNENVDVICPCCNDFGVYTAAYVAEKLGLGCFDSYKNTLAINNKDSFKRLAADLDILTPLSISFDNSDTAKAYIKGVRYPIIVKPSDASAGNGVTKLESADNADVAIDFAFAKSKNKKIVIEEFLTGTQHGFCTYLIGEKVVAVCTNNEYSIINPYRVEMDTFPADNYEKYEPFLIGEIERIAKYLHLKDGIFHLQYIVNNGKPYIIEVMRRVLGNMYSVPANMLNDINWDYWEVKARCGLNLADFPLHVKQEGYFAYKSILSNCNGVIKKITIPKEYEEYIVDACYIKSVGDIVDSYKNEPIGFLFMKFNNMEEMKKVLIDNYSSHLVTVE